MAWARSRSKPSTTIACSSLWRSMASVATPGREFRHLFTLHFAFWVHNAPQGEDSCMRAELSVGGGAAQPDKTAGNLIAAKRTPVGIAFGAGAARGWAHIGVVNRLVEAGIVPSAIAGTSIGALVGGCFAAGRIEKLEEFARALTWRRLF